ETQAPSTPPVPRSACGAHPAASKYNPAGVLQEPKFLSAEQFLLTTLIVKLAVMAVLATMLARYRRFRHILIFERRGWLDRMVFIDLHKHVWQMIRKIEPNWQMILLLAPIALELLRQALGTRFGEQRLFFLGSPSPWMMLLVVLATVLAVATPIRIWNSARI